MAAASDSIPTLPTIDPWTIVFRSAPFTDPHLWFSDALTKSLIQAPAVDTPARTTTSAVSKKTKCNPTTGVAAAETRKKRRRPRASKNSPTTFIAADAASFRMMVQQVTGMRLPVRCGTTSSSATVPQRPVVGVGRPDQGWLPTLDTSALFLVDVAGDATAAALAAVGYVPATEHDGDCGAGFDFGAAFEDVVDGAGFPTLEPWRVVM